jgi:putative peptide zinc metalloprotease protein
MAAIDRFLDGMMGGLFRDTSAVSFSDVWYRVGPTTPVLSPHAQIMRQRFGGRTLYVVEDPAGGQFYRMTEAAYLFVGMLDGRRTADDAWEACVAQFGDSAPTQRECVDLLSKLQLFGLLSGDLPLLPEMIGQRRQQHSTRKMQRRLGGGIAPTVPLWNPERILHLSRHLLRAIYSWPGLIAWLALISVALYTVFTNRSQWFDGLSGVLDPENFLWMSVVFVVLRAIHELGHAAACKAMGGRCTEIGLMFMAYVFPFPYCDASSAWRFPEVGKRVLVSLGGVLAESVPAAIAAIIWAKAEPGLVKTLAFNTVVISGITSVIFNLNPLLRYDGYYVLSDLTGIANLSQRAQQTIRHVFERGVLKVKGRPAPAVRGKSELAFLLSYGVLSWCYRLIVTFTIAIVLLSSPTYLVFGVAMAIVMLVIAIIWPLMKGVGYLATSPLLMGKRARAIAIVGGTLAVIAIVVGLIPAPNAGYAAAVVEPRTSSAVRIGVDGYIDRVMVRAGDAVNAGDVLFTIRNEDVVQRLGAMQAGVARSQAELQAVLQHLAADRLQAELNLAQARIGLADAEREAAHLEVRAEIAGRVVAPEGTGGRLDDLVGRFASKGTMIAEVASMDDLVVRCSMSDRAYALIFQDKFGASLSDVRAAVRVRGDAGRVVPVRITRAGPLASREVENRSMTAPMGGEILMDPRDTKNATAIDPQFVMELTPAERIATWQPGLRAKARFEAPREPLASQWYRWARQYFSDRLES